MASWMWSSCVTPALSSEMGVMLAADILEDHFGEAVGIVGCLLMRRGALSVQEILRYCAEEHSDPGKEALRFHHVRNALLTLVQHNLAMVKPHPVTAQNEALRGLISVYSVRVDDVLTRMRYPHFVEHCYWHYGDVSAEVMAVILRYGRATKAHVLFKVRERFPEVGAEEAEDAFDRLLKEQLLRPAEAFSSGHASNAGLAATGSASSSSTALPPADAPAPLTDAAPPTASAAAVSSAAAAAPVTDAAPAGGGDGPPAKRRRNDGEGGGGGLAATLVDGDDEEEEEEREEDTEDRGGSTAPGGAAAAGTAAAAKQAAPAVFCCNRPVLHLCVMKNLTCQLIEAKVNGISGQVVSVLLTKVNVSGDPNSKDVVVDWVKFEEIQTKLKEGGLMPEGRDPRRAMENVRQVLDLLASHKDGILRKRTVHVNPQSTSSSSGIARQASKRGSPASDIVSSTPVANTSTIDEWSIEWNAVRKLLVQALTSQLIRDQFGQMGLRMFNLLSDGDPPQKLEDSFIFQTCMVTPQEGREILNEMVKRSIVCWQEVPKSSNTPLAASFWLYYVDHKRLAATLLWSVLQTILNLRIRFRLEMNQGAPLESRIQSLSKKERAALKEGRKAEDIIERAYLVLDTALLDFQSA